MARAVAALVFGGPNADCAGQVGESFSDYDSAAVEVDTAPSQRQHLADA
jgi:hypothetical protein